jgi:hypothetical protein
MLEEHVRCASMKPESKAAKPEPNGSQPSEFENFARAVKTIMAVPKDAIDAHKPIRPRQRVDRPKAKK